MKRFCFWQGTSQFSNIFICGGKLFSGHIGNCPYKNLKIAKLRCSEVSEKNTAERYIKRNMFVHKYKQELNLTTVKRFKLKSKNYKREKIYET